MSARKLQSVPQPAPDAPDFTPTLWTCQLYPNYTLTLPALGATVAFKGGNLTVTDPAIDAELRRLKGQKPIRPWSGVAIHRCGFCDFVSTDLEEVEEHRRLGHDQSQIMEG